MIMLLKHMKLCKHILCSVYFASLASFHLNHFGGSLLLFMHPFKAFGAEVKMFFMLQTFMSQLRAEGFYLFPVCYSPILSKLWARKQECSSYYKNSHKLVMNLAISSVPCFSFIHSFKAMGKKMKVFFTHMDPHKLVENNCHPNTIQFI